MKDWIGRSIGRYHIVEMLGEGGMATVFRAYDTHLERDVAIKMIRSDEFAPAILENVLQRFTREARSLAKLMHPNIISVIDYGEVDQTPYLVMPYVSGGTLKQLAVYAISFDQAARLLYPIAQALSYAHSQGVIHRDVKPSNILITETGNPLITDFGIAKLLDTREGLSLTGSGVGIGTPEYMAPEQGVGGEIDGRVDIYALGVVFFELITGRKPFSGDTPMAVLIKQMFDPLPNPREIIPDLPVEVETAIFKAMAKKPEDRYANMAEFATVLNKISGLGKTSNSTTEVFTDFPKPPLRDTVEVQLNPPSILRPVWKLTGPFLYGIFGLVAIVILALILILGRDSFKKPPFATVPSVTNVVLDGTPSPTIEDTPTLTVSPTFTLTPTPSETPEPTLTPTESGISPIDGMKMILIPAGEFLMGATEENFYPQPHEKPQHTVYLDDYWIDQVEVTVAMFQKFIEATNYSTDADRLGFGAAWIDNGYIDLPKANWKSPHGPEQLFYTSSNDPVVQVSWNDASAYCAWVGRHLPTEAQWEKAARGLDGQTFPWGNNHVASNLLNFADKNFPRKDWSAMDMDDGYKFTAPVGSYPDGISPFGVMDMAGNAEEWVADRYSPTYFSISPYRNPTGPDTGANRVTKGGSWGQNEYGSRSVTRWSKEPTDQIDTLGFRCAQ